MSPYQIAILNCFYEDNLINRIVDVYDPNKNYSLFDLFSLAEEIKESN